MPRKRPSAMTPILVDTARLQQRRLEIGMTARRLENLLGVGGTWIHSVETGRNHASITLGELNRLATELGLSLVDLLADGPADPAPLPADHPQALRADATQLGRILVDLSHQTPPSRICAALGWTAQRLDMALDVLERQLPLVGQRLVRGVNGVQIARDGQVEVATAELASARISDKGIDPTQANVMGAVAACRLDARNTTRGVMTNAKRTALDELVNAGLIIRPAIARGSSYTLNPRVRSSLLLDDATQAAATKTKTAKSNRTSSRTKSKTTTKTPNNDTTIKEKPS